MILNDLLDQTTDSIERPSRPIPSGRVSTKQAWALYVLFSLIATLTVVFTVPAGIYTALTLFGLIFLYNWSHRWLPVSPVLMGACRGAVYLLAATAGGWSYSGNDHPLVWTMAISLTTYVTLLSMVARSELAAKPSPLQWIALGLCFLTFFIPNFNSPWIFSTAFVWIWVASSLGALWVSWIIRQVRLKQLPLANAVGKLLAAISLLDGLSLAKAGAAGGVFLAGSCFFGTLAWHKKIRGT